jgi:hypothetical protein
MPFGNFFEKLDVVLLKDGQIGVTATGPKAREENIKEICVWVFQRNGANDAAATEMTTVAPKALDQRRTKWTLQIGKIDSGIDVPFQTGPAIGLAIALIETPKKDEAGEPELDEAGNPKVLQRVLLWSQSIDLKDTVGGAEAGDARQTKGALAP